MITLDESLFDDDMNMQDSIHIFPSDHFAEYGKPVNLADYYDDDIFEYEPLAGAVASTDHKGEAIPEGPKDGLDSGVADSLINLINDEWEAIQGYNTFRAMVLDMSKTGTRDYTSMLEVIDEVINEENRHVGQLQELLKGISPNTASIEKGQEEAKEQLASDHEWVNGKLKVEAHAPMVQGAVSKSAPNDIETTCALVDVDDEW